MIEVRRLSFSYPGSASPALKGLDLSIPPGSLFGLLGPNGSGKTTLISLLCGLLPSAKGQVALDAQPSLVPQEYAFYPRLTLFENLAFFAGVQSIPAEARNKRIAEVLKITGLEGAQGKRAEACSGGMKRRLNIAIGLLNRPKLLFLDEPTVGIDPQSRRFILAAVKRINKQGCTIIYTSHYMEEVEELCDRVGILDQGKLISLLKGKQKNLEALFMRLTKRRLRD